MKAKRYVSMLILLLMLLETSYAASKSKMSEKLKIVIPSVRLEDATVEDAIDFIRRIAKKQDPDGVGINIVLYTDKSKTQNKKINLDADNMPVGEIIKYVCDQSGLPYKVDKYAVVIGQSKNLTALKTKFYLAQPKLIQIIDDNFNGDSQKFLETLGMKFSPGAKVVLVRTKSRLVVTNIDAEHAKIAKILKQL